MPNANIYLTWQGQTRLLKVVDEDNIVQYSKVVRDAFQNQETRPNCVTITGAAPGPLHFVIDKALKFGDKLKLVVHDGKIDRAVMIYQAVNALGIDKPQPHIEAHIVGFASHERMDPKSMVAIHKAFGAQGSSNRIWRVMVHQIAWDSVHGKFTDEQKEALVKETVKLPDLDKALLQRAEYLAEKKGNHEFALYAKKKAEEAKKVKEEERQARIDQKKAIAETNRRVREYKQNQWYEETHGLRPASDKTVEFIMTGQKGIMFPVKPAKKGKGKQKTITDNDEGSEKSEGVEQDPDSTD